SKLTSGVARHPRCIEADTTFVPSTSTEAGTTNTAGFAAAAAVRGPDSGYDCECNGPSGRLARPTSTPFTYTTTPSSTRAVTTSEPYADGSATSNVRRNCALIGRFVVGGGTSMFVTIPSEPNPNGATPVLQPESSNP